MTLHAVALSLETRCLDVGVLSKKYECYYKCHPLKYIFMQIGHLTY